MEKNRIKIIIDGQTYNVISDEDELHVMKVAETVDRQIQSIKKKAGHLTPTMIAVLGAMNITDEFIKYQKKDNESMAIKEKESELEVLNQKIAKLQGEMLHQSDLNTKSDEQVIFLQRKLTEKQEVIGKMEIEVRDDSNILALDGKIAELEHALENQKTLNRQLIDSHDDVENLNGRIIDLESLVEEKSALNQQLKNQLEKAEILNQEFQKSQQIAQEQLALTPADDSKVMELEVKLNQSQQQIMEFDEKIFYLQRKLTDKEEELQGAKRELEDFIIEFEK
jgi:cell division protein ZapA